MSPPLSLTFPLSPKNAAATRVPKSENVKTGLEGKQHDFPFSEQTVYKISQVTPVVTNGAHHSPPLLTDRNQTNFSVQ